MDNPFIGLDAETRDQLKELLSVLTTERDIEVMLVLSKTDDIPEFVSKVIEITPNGEQVYETVDDYYAHQQPIPAQVLSEEKRQAILNLPATVGRCQDKMAVASQPCCRWCVQTIRRAMPATSRCSTVQEVRARASGTSRNTSAMCRPRCTVPTSATCPPFALWPAD